MKKIFSAFLLMTMMVASVGSFVSCSDIEDAIAKVENTANDNAAQIKDLEGKIAALQTALATAQADAAAAKAEANAAKQAAATARAEAIEAALAEIAKVQDDVDAANAEIKKINDALAGKATVEAVELLENTVKEYKALTDENAEAIEAIEAELAALKEAGVTAENFAKVVADMKKINEDLVNFVKAIANIANRIQSITFVPEYSAVGRGGDFIFPFGYSVPQKGKTERNYTPVMFKATYEVSPKELAENITSDMVYFSTVATKAADAEYFEAMVADADNETGRIVVYGYVPYAESISESTAAFAVMTDNDFGYATEAGLPYIDVAFALNIADNKPEELNGETIQTGTYVQSSYVSTYQSRNTFVYEDVVDLFTTYNTSAPAASAISNAFTKTYEVAYSTAVADSKKSVFENMILAVILDGSLMTVPQAEAFLGFPLEITTDEATTTTVPAELKVTKSKLASTVEFKKALDKAASGKEVTVSVDGFKVNGAAIAVTADATYKIVDKAYDNAITFSDVTVAWKHDRKHAGTTMKVAIDQELAVTGIDDITKVLPKGTGLSYTFNYEYQDKEDNDVTGTLTITPLSKSAVQVTGVVDFIDDIAHNGVKVKLAKTVDNVKYDLVFNLNIGARPADKEIDLGEFTVVGKTQYEQKIAATPVAAILAADASFYGTIAVKDQYKYFPIVAAPTAGTIATDTAVLEVGYKANSDGEYTAEKSYIHLGKVSEYGKTYELEQVYTVCDVEYTVKATIKTTTPQYTIAPNTAFVNANGEVNIGGKVTYPTVTTTQHKTGNVVTSTTYETTTNGTAFVLDQINLRDYVHVTCADNVNEVKVMYVLRDGYKKDSNGEVTTTPAENLASFSQTSDVPVFVSANAGIAGTTGNDAIVYTNDTKKSQFVYDIYLVDATDTENVLDQTTVTVIIPDVVTLTAPTTVAKTYKSGVENTINVAGALKVVDYKNQAVYNPYATTLTDLLQGYTYNTETGYTPKTAATDKVYYNLYGQEVKVRDKDGNKHVKVTINGVEQPNFVYTLEDDGTIKVPANDANITNEIVFEVTVYMSSKYDNGTPDTVKAVVKFTPAN